MKAKLRGRMFWIERRVSVRSLGKSRLSKFRGETGVDKRKPVW
jgi:hypothetical protein